jgi:hypothetical protein
MSIGDHGRPLALLEVIEHDLNVETGDTNETANASRTAYLLVASGYMAASGNSILITSTARTTSTLVVSTLGVMQTALCFARTVATANCDCMRGQFIR